MKLAMTFGPGVALIGVTGAALGGIIIPEWDFVVATGLVATLGGALAIGLFGQPGLAGWLSAALGAVLATCLGAGLLGGIMYFPDGVWIAPMTVFVSFDEHIAAAPSWFGLMILAHLVTRDRLRVVNNLG